MLRILFVGSNAPTLQYCVHTTLYLTGSELHEGEQILSRSNAVTEHLIYADRREKALGRVIYTCQQLVNIYGIVGARGSIVG
jgi:hypothetical protein